MFNLSKNTYWFLPAFTLLALLCGCNADEGPVIPRFLTLFEEVDQNQLVGSKLENLTFQVLGSDNRPFEGANVFFSSEDSVMISDSLLVTDANGLVSVDLTFGGVAETVTIEAEAPGLLDSPFELLFFLQAERPAKILIVEGNLQEDQPGDLLSTPMKVQVTDEFENPIVNVQVRFEQIKGDGAILFPESTTDREGMAQTRFRLGEESAHHQVRASVNENVEVIFDAMALVRPQLRVQGTTNSVELEWDKIEGPNFKSYTIYRMPPRTSLREVVAVITDQETVRYIDEDVPPAGSYDYEIHYESVFGAASRSTRELGEVGDFITFDESISELIVDFENGMSYLLGDNNLYFVSNATRTVTRTVPLSGIFWSLYLTSDKQKLYVGRREGRIYIIDTATGQLVRRDIRAGVGDGDIRAFYKATNGQLLVDTYTATSSLQRSFIAMVDPEQNFSRIAISSSLFGGVTEIDGDDGEFLYATNRNYFFKLSLKASDSLEVLAEYRDFTTGSKILSLDGTRLFARTGPIFSTEDFSQVGFLRSLSSPILSKDGKRYMGFRNNAMEVYDSETLVQLSQMELGNNTIHAALSPDESQLIMVSASNNNVKLYFIEDL